MGLYSSCSNNLIVKLLDYFVFLKGQDFKEN